MNGQVAQGLATKLATTAGFRYLRAVRLHLAHGLTRARRHALPAAGRVTFALVFAIVGIGCHGRARTPRQAWERFTAALATHDPAQVYPTLDLQTRWSLMTVRRAEREAYDITLSNLPEGPARERQLRRFEKGALAETDAALFASLTPQDRLEALEKDIGKGGPLADPAPDAREVKIPGSSTGAAVLLLRKGNDGSWGFAGFSAEAEEWKRKATADLDLVRANAADLERAATRAGL